MDFHQTLPPQPRYIRYIALYCYYFPNMLGQVRFRLGQIRAHDRQNFVTVVYSSMDFHQNLSPQPQYIRYVAHHCYYFSFMLGQLDRFRLGQIKPMTDKCCHSTVLINGFAFAPTSATSAAIHLVYSTLLLLFSLYVRSG